MERTEVPPRGVIFNIQRFCLHDGPGIRTCVFLKGCPLSCPWCSNPEGQLTATQIELHHDRCLRCGRCRAQCLDGALSVDDQGALVVDQSRCTGCGRCQEVCPAEAIRLVGKSTTVEEVLEEIEKDHLLFRNSGGGVTLTGGEPLMQASFSTEVMRRAQLQGVHTAMETCALAPWEVLRKALAHLDLVLCDLKVVDDKLARHYLGHSVAVILENIQKMDESGTPMIIRIPLVPMITDTSQNLQDLIHFLERLSHATRVDLLPYHDLGKTKYGRLDREYLLSGARMHTSGLLEEIRLLFSSRGFDTTLRGDRA